MYLFPILKLIGFFPPKRSGLLVLSDLRVYTLPCRTEERYSSVKTRPYLQAAVGFAAAAPVADSPPTSTLVAEHKEAHVGGGADSDLALDNEILPVEIRDYFPETWLWSLELVGQTGRWFRGISNREDLVLVAMPSLPSCIQGKWS